MLNLPHIFKQEKNYTCGPACVLMILKFFNKPIISENQLEKKAQTNDIVGTTRENIVRTITDFGLQVDSKFDSSFLDIKNSIEQLHPVLLYYWSEDESDHSVSWFHYSIAININNEYIDLADPWTGSICQMSLIDFEKVWYCDNGLKKWIAIVKK